MTIQQALTEFQIEQQIRGNTPKTIQYYSLSVGLYARFAGFDTPLQEITLNSLDNRNILLTMGANRCIINLS